MIALPVRSLRLHAVGFALVAVLTSAAFPMLAHAAPPPGDSTESFAAARFGLSVDGSELASFSSLTNFESSVALDEKLRRLVPTCAVSLTRGLSASLELWSWHELATIGGPRAARNATLVAYSVDGAAIARWNIESAWPSKMQISSLKAGASEVLFEGITLNCARVVRVAP